MLSRRLLVFLIAIAYGAGSSVCAQSPPSLVGTWRLISAEVADASGVRRPYWKESPSGLLIYTSDGHVAAQVYDSGRPRLGVPWKSASPDAAQKAFVGMSSYFGTYNIDPAAKTVTHLVEGAMSPDWIGTKLVRSYRFLDRNRLELSVVPDAQVVTNGLVLVWQRIP